jgi:hypothetical protein
VIDEHNNTTPRAKCTTEDIDADDKETIEYTTGTPPEDESSGEIMCQ